MNYNSMTKKELIAEINRLKNEDGHNGDQNGCTEEESVTAHRLSKLLNFLPIGIVIETPDRKIEQANPALCGIFGLDIKPDKLIGMDCSEATEKVKHMFPDGEAFISGIEEIISRRKPVFYEEMALCDGRIFERDYIPYENAEGQQENMWLFRDISRQKEHEKSLQESEGKFRNLAEHIPGVIYLCKNDERWTMLYLNDAVQEFTGYPKDDFLNDRISFVNIYHPDDSEKIFDQVEKALAAKKQFHLVYRIKHKNGAWRWIEEVGCGIYKNDQLVMLEGFLTDITDRKKAEEALRDSEQNYRDLYLLFRTISDNMTDMLWAKDMNKKYIFANRAICDNLLIAKDTNEPIGKNDLFFARREREQHPDNPEWHTFGEICRDSDRIIMDSKQAAQFDEYGNVRGKFLFLDVHKSPLFNDEGKMIGVVGSARDVTREKEIIKRLQQSEQQYRNLIQHSGDAIYLLYNRRFEIINDKFEQLFGLTLEDMNRDDFDFINLVAPKSRPLVEDRIKRMARGEKLEPKYEFTALDSRGREVEVEASVTYIQYKDGFASQGILRDITQRKQLENQLRQAQKMEAVGQLAGGVAHDFNNLLTVINGYCDLLTLKNLSAEIKNPLDQIKRAGKRAEQLTGQLLAYSRKQIVQPKIINLNDLIADYLKMLGRLLGEDIEISTILNPNLEMINVDPGQMEQIIMNISINARDAMPYGGQLVIETANVKFDKNYVENHAGAVTGNYVMLSLTDNGVGMDDVTLNRIFEPFYTTKGRDKGTGLGLSTVYGIVKQNRGFIYVYSEIQKGTSFKIYLPPVEATIDSAEAEDQKMRKFHGGEKILLVEDDEGVRQVTKSTLLDYGYSVIEAVNGEEALQIYDERNDEIDLLLTDVVMPVMNGAELAERLREKNPDLKVLYFSGYTDSSIVHHGVLDKGNDFIQKPYSHIDLAKKIREVLDRKRL